MTDILTGVQSNNLLKSVLHDLKVPQFLAGTKALGLISRLITGPLWCLIEDKQIHILDMNRIYSKLVDFLERECSPENLIEFMEGKAFPFEGLTELKRDAIYESLIAQWKHDDLVQLHLAVIIPALAKLANHIFKDHLPGGCWSEVTEPMKEKSVGTQKHNEFAESVFGYLDNLLRKNPNISMITSEAFIMFSASKTDEWLQSKCEEEKLNLITAALKDKKKIEINISRAKE